MADQQRFSEREASAIIRRAAQLQASAASKGQDGGVSLTDLQALAEEAGIDPALLRQAMLETEGGQASGSPREIVRVVEGELDPSEFDVINEAVGPIRFNAVASQVGRSMQRFARAAPGHAILNIISRNGSTKITVRKSYLAAFMVFCYPMLTLSFVLGVNLFARGQTGAGLLAAILLPAIALVGFVVAKGYHDRNAEVLANRVAEAVSSYIRSRSPQSLRGSLAAPDGQQAGAPLAQGNEDRLTPR